MRTQKVWFAEKTNGDIIELTEMEALTHFEQNNIAQRMRLRFIGTSDGSKYAEGKAKVQQFLREKTAEVDGYNTMNALDKKIADSDLRARYTDEISAIVKEAYEAELAQARSNGVQKPDPTLRIFTQKDGGKAQGIDRQKIINSI